MHVANDLTNLLPHIDEVREQLSQIGDTEQSLVKDLAGSLKILDQQLLQDVRQVAADHQIRRGTILNALEDLAGSIGMFRPQHEDALPKPVGAPQPAARPQPVAAIPEPIDYGHQYAPTAGDWRQATKNLQGRLDDLQDELEFQLNSLNGTSSKN
jgi:hypothetical protein